MEYNVLDYGAAGDGVTNNATGSGRVLSAQRKGVSQTKPAPAIRI